MRRRRSQEAESGGREGRVGGGGGGGRRGRYLGGHRDGTASIRFGSLRRNAIVKDLLCKEDNLEVGIRSIVSGG